MNFHIFKIRCITNLHVGSGDINYAVIDKEVEKDPLTNLPIIHASGIKGALLNHFQKTMDKNTLNSIFGTPGNGDVSKPGSYRFLDAHLLSRPMRTENDKSSFINVTTVEMLQDFLDTVKDFCCENLNKSIPTFNFDSSQFWATENVSIEGISATVMDEAQKQESAWLELLMGKKYAFAANIKDYALPIIARNHLENGISSNLWYEEFVPYGSVFFMVILTPEKECKLDFSKPIQIGGNASIGYGFTKIEEIDLNELCKENINELSKS